MGRRRRGSADLPRPEPMKIQRCHPCEPFSGAAWPRSRRPSAWLTLALPAVGAAQDETDDPLDAPSPFCAVLTADEASAAMGVPLTVGSSSATDCSYDADPDTSTNEISLIAQRVYGPLADEELYYEDAVDLVVAEHPAFFSAEAAGLFVDEGANDQLFVLQLFGEPPEKIDVQAAFEGLAALGLPRLASIPLPVEPTLEPEPSYFGDAELAALIPTEIEGSTVDIETYSGADILADTDPSDPDAEESLQALQEQLAARGKTMDDLSLAFASYATEESFGSLTAIRVKGVDISTMTQDLLPLLLADVTESVLTPSTIAGKAVTIISEAPLASGSPAASEDPFGDITEQAYIYPHGEVLWFVVADEPGLTELFGKLP